VQLTHHPCVVAVADTDHLVAAANRRQHFRAAQQPKRRLLLGGGRQQLKEIPLRNQRNVLVRTRNSAQVDADLGALNLHIQRVDLAVRHPREFVGQSQFVEQPQGAGMDGVAAEVAQEVGVLFHHRDVDAAAGKQQAQHDSGGTAAGDDACGVLDVVTVGRHPVIFASNSLAGWAASSTGGTASNCGCRACRSSFRPPW
jgi:hypothetical protein